MKAWHFVGETLRDGRPVPADGVTLKHDGPVIPCQSGLHGSKRIIDALKYAPWSTHWICRVELGGEIVSHEDDKLVASERTILWRVEADDVLRQFARRCALDVVHLWDAPDVVVLYLKTGDETLRAAAWAAARAAALDAARATARAAARAAAGAAAGAAVVPAAGAATVDATLYATLDATLDAAWAAWDAARAQQNRRLTAMVTARKP